MSGDESVHYGKFLRWIFAPTSSSESGHQANVSSHLVRIDANFLPELSRKNQHLESMKQDVGWWTLLEISSLWAFYLHVVIVMIATHCNSLFFLNNVRFIAP